MWKLLPRIRRPLAGSGPSDAVERMTELVLAAPADRQRHQRSLTQYGESGLSDYLFTDCSRGQDCDQVFDRLRWGGQVGMVGTRPREVDRWFRSFSQRPEFQIDRTPQRFEGPAPASGRRPRFRFKRPRRSHLYFVARKVLLDRPRELTTRHSYDVYLAPRAAGHVVVKQIPTFEQTVQRLARMMPEAPEQALNLNAHKLVTKVFPIFLTREAAFLRILEERLPAALQRRVPRVLHLEQDEHGLVRKVELNWMRMGAASMPLLEFAAQSMELLRALHDRVGVIHLDLRLDNIVITEAGVGFVDFGSAVKVDEDLSQNQLLHTLLSEMVSASQIHRDLQRLQAEGRVTSSLFRDCYQRMDRAIDLFYLAVQMTYPDNNPEFRGLVDCRRQGEPYEHLEQLRRDILRPRHPDQPPYTSADDVYQAMGQIRASEREIN